MKRSLMVTAAVTLVGLLQALGCASASPDRSTCSVGSEGCSCTSVGSCDGQLSCLSSVCVNAGAGATATGAGTTGSTTSTSTNGMSGDGSNAEQACADSAAASCDKLANCAPAAFRILYGDADTCQTREALACRPNVQLAGSTWTPAAETACAAALRGATCAQWLAQDEVALEACSFHPGPLANGAACGSSAQCQTAICHSSAASTCGVCGPAQQLGDACQTDAECDRGLTCVNDVCLKLPTVGQACAPSTGCSTPYVCKGGACAKPAQPGEACTPGTCDPFAGSFCAGGGTCQSFQYAAAGEPCSVSLGVLCERGGTCRLGTSSGAGVGTCVKFAADGAACDPDTGPHCLSPAKCTGGFCGITDPAVCR